MTPPMDPPPTLHTIYKPMEIPAELMQGRPMQWVFLDTDQPYQDLRVRLEALAEHLGRHGIDQSTLFLTKAPKGNVRIHLAIR